MAKDTTTSSVSIPAYAKPYVERMLGRTEALTSQPYQVYGGERTAQFTPLQQQAFAGAETMQPAWQMGAASGLTGEAAGRALGTRYDPFRMGQFTPSTAASYMSPYMQNVVDIAQRDARRQSGIQRTQDLSQATAQGAYGGARSAIVEAERQRNLGQQLGDIQSKGLQSAYEQAQNRFGQEQQLREQSRQYGAGLGMQGLQTALQGAGQLGQLGGQQFQQGMDINKLQAQYGGVQQQQVQNILGQQYADFLAQRKYPYEQLSYMSDMLRGLPLTGSGAQTSYTAPPSMFQQVGSLGLGAYGLSKMFDEGGEVYAYGGEVGADSDGYFGDGGTAGTSDYPSSFGLGGIALNKLVGGEV